MKRKKANPLYSAASSEEIATDLEELIDFQNEGLSLKKLSKLIDEKLVPHLMHYDRPEFHSLYNCFPEEGAEFGAKIALNYNQGVTNWQVSPGGVMLEELCGKALCRIFGLSSNSDATFMYCGTYANQQALYLALHRKAEQMGFDLGEMGLQGFKDPSRLVALTSSEAHLSLRHALRIMGLGDTSLVTLPVDSNYRIDVKKMQEIVGELKKTKDIFCIIATAGTTSTGSIDPIIPLKELCEELNVWLHVDGAYGLAFSLVPELKHLFSGIELADSVTWDPHKQFWVPIPNSLLFVRNKEDFNRMAIYGEYFNRKDDIEPNPGLKSPPTTRPLSALPLVTSMRHQGISTIIEKLNAIHTAIKAVAENLENEADMEVCHEPETGILCIRHIPKNFPEEKLDELQKYIYESIKAEGQRSISMTRLSNKTVLRIVAISPNVTEKAIMDTISNIRTIANEY